MRKFSQLPLEEQSKDKLDRTESLHYNHPNRIYEENHPAYKNAAHYFHLWHIHVSPFEILNRVRGINENTHVLINLAKELCISNELQAFRCSPKSLLIQKEFRFYPLRLI